MPTKAAEFSVNNLPPELYSEIAANFQDPSDRPTLLSLALVDRIWCSESQRVLFRRLCDECVDTHVRFLRAIVAQPNRLGPLVRSYAQLSLVSNFPSKPLLLYGTKKSKASSTILDAPRGREGADLELWELTLKALPMFANLNQLEFVPQRHSVTSEATEVLSRCTFHLTHLSWGCEFNRHLEQFLRTHGALLKHLDLGLVAADLRLLSSQTCPALTLVSCGYTSVPCVMNSRRITTLRLSDNARSVLPQLDIHPSVAGAIRYLSMDRYSPHQGFFNTVLLEFLIWSIEVRFTIFTYGVHISACC